jgi:long-chain fatty acid transport protein
LALASRTRAGSVDNRNNNSAEYIRSLSRNAATEGADAAIYNPAGTVRFVDGLHVSISNQTIAKFNEHKLAKPSVAYESDIVSPLYPTAFAVYKRDNWSAFSAFSFPGGGGELDYKEGSATVFPIQTNLSFFHPPRNADVFLRSIYYGFTAGGAYTPKEWLSVSLAARALYARTDINVDAGVSLPPGNTSTLIDHMEESRGVTGILGVDVFPMKGLTLGLRIEGPTSLEWEVQKSSLNLDSVLKDPNLRAGYVASVRQVLRAPGSKFQRDLPANVGLGAGYDLGSGMRTDFSFNYYFNTLADWGGQEDNHDDGWEASLSFQYLWPFRLLTSAGAQYTVSGANSASYSIENPALDSYSIGAGGRYGITDRLGVNAGFTGNFAIEDDGRVAPLNTTAELRKHVLVYALGLEYRFF